MKIDDLNELPEWDDDQYDDEEIDGDSWKPNPTKEACKALYQQWGTVLIVLKAAFDSLKKPSRNAMFSSTMLKDHLSMIIGDAYEVAAKIRSSEAGGLYIIRLENAAIIRKNAQFIKISTNSFITDEIMDDEHRLIIRDEIDKFRELFKVWISTFEKDEFEDEWGLFV